MPWLPESISSATLKTEMVFKVSREYFPSANSFFSLILNDHRSVRPTALSDADTLRYYGDVIAKQLPYSQVRGPPFFNFIKFILFLNMFFFIGVITIWRIGARLANLFFTNLWRVLPRFTEIFSLQIFPPILISAYSCSFPPAKHRFELF